MVVDRATLAARLGHGVPATQAWVVGADAAPRVDALVSGERRGRHDGSDSRGLAQGAQGGPSDARSWLAVRGGVRRRRHAARVLAVALVAASGSDERTRAIARTRVVGAPRSAAHRVAWLEVAVPATIASAAGLLVGFLLDAASRRGARPRVCDRRSRRAVVDHPVVGDGGRPRYRPCREGKRRARDGEPWPRAPWRAHEGRLIRQVNGNIGLV